MLHLRQNNLHIPITITLLHQHHRVFHQGHPMTSLGAFRWWIGTEVASLMNVNCSKLSLLDSTTSTSGPFVFSCSSSRVQTYPSQLGIFERYDKDRSGKIDPLELRDALYGIGYAVPGSVLQLLLSKYGDGSGRRVELGFDSFVECGMIIKVKLNELLKPWTCLSFLYFFLCVSFSSFPLIWANSPVPLFV
ncbi:probable calcium-binding protein CML48-like isoform X2 [Glycine max]|uniref:probable calcium-binding protein CML48-like isoform X2 n=1 Tax=Glycine max TaxID=3847 RepID=UPI001B3567E9|nr:uncharacterized protein LOC100499969 isoform X2 [Glycine max]